MSSQTGLSSGPSQVLEESSDAWSLQHFPMPFYLLFASIANVAFLVVAVRRLLKVPQSGLSRAFVAQAIGELCWVLPCFAQCFITFAKGTRGEWYQGYKGTKENSTGCDVMGFYSLFSLVAGMGTTILMAFMTERILAGKPLPQRFVVDISIVAIFSLAFLYALLPIIGVHRYKFISPICYYDWYETSHSVLILLWNVPALFAGTALLAKCASHKSVMATHCLAYFLSWMLWPPAAVIGLAGAEMPKHMMIVGGVLGHGQALVNPLLYGLVWNAAFPEKDYQSDVVDASAKGKQVDNA